MRKIEQTIIEAIRTGSKRRLSAIDRVNFPLGADRVADVYLHATCIAEIYTDHIVINSGGWHTRTTKSRLNAILREYCGMSIYQKDYAWYLYDYCNRTEGPEYTDGMSIPRRRVTWAGSYWKAE